jgi:hypothetical protein
MFLRFVGTFTEEDHPDLLAISGGEAFLRPALLAQVADLAREKGSYSTALSGMYWAKDGRIPPTIKRAIDSLDHFSVSIDVFHEREVPRSGVFEVLHILLSEGKDVSVHVVGLGETDPYLEKTTYDIREEFDDRVPMLVNGVNAMGRAAEWFPRNEHDSSIPVEAFPCTLSGWPVVGYDGTILACGNDDVVEGPAPEHLVLGNAATSTWGEIREKALGSPMVRAIRTYGPAYVNKIYGSGAVECTGFCSTCQKLSTDPELPQKVELAMSKPSAATVEAAVNTLQVEGGAKSFVERFAMGRYSDLITLGHPGFEKLAKAEKSPDAASQATPVRIRVPVRA